MLTISGQYLEEPSTSTHIQHLQVFSIDIDIFWSQFLIFVTFSRKNAWKLSLFVGVFGYKSYLNPGTPAVMIKLDRNDPCHAKFVAITAGHQLPLTHRTLTVPQYQMLRVLNRLFLYSCSKPEHPPVGDHSCTTGNRSRNLCYDSWSLSHLGYLQLQLWSSLIITGVVPGINSPGD